MRKYTEAQVLSSLRGQVNFNGKTITVDGSLGIKSWGMVDFFSKSLWLQNNN